MSSCQVDPRVDAAAYNNSPLVAAETGNGSSANSEPTQDVVSTVNNPLDCGCEREASTGAYDCVSKRFLHSDENLEECDTDAENDGDENLSQEQEHRGKQAAFQQRGAVDSPVGSSSERKTKNRSPHRWANRQLHRSVSVDDLMEYQREFRLENVGRANSAHDLTDYQREFQAILAEHQHETLNPTNENDANNNTITTRTKERQTISPQKSNKRSAVRNSIANSDLAEFKRQFCQERAARNRHIIKRAHSTDDGNTLRSKELKHKKRQPKEKEEATLARKLENLKNAMDYQWGTRSLRRAMLGSDLGTFERSVRTALLESSRENSSSGSFDSTSDQEEEQEDGDEEIPDPPALLESSSSLGMNHRDSQDLRVSQPIVNFLESQGQEEDWGTRSLRRSLKELDLTEPTTPTYQAKPMHTLQEDEMVLPLDAPLSAASPWKDDKKHPPSSNGLKMPRRVISGDTEYHPEERRKGNDDNNNHSDKKISKSATPQSRSQSVNDIGPLAIAPEFEWQLRSCFRRSISSSDIEKYQRHFEDDKGGGGGNTNDSGDSMDDRSAHTIAAVGSARTVESGGQPAVHPLLANLPPASSDLLADDNANSDEAARPPRPPRRHRRVNSDEPELHMEDVVADVAPRKPTRTTSRPISPPPPARSAVVRFADCCNEVVEIPKVSDDLKPYLFYTKRDVKRFRMNEHRRQEEQIRQYMEYLNQKENVLDSSPGVFD